MICSQVRQSVVVFLFTVILYTQTEHSGATQLVFTTPNRSRSHVDRQQAFYSHTEPVYEVPYQGVSLCHLPSIQNAHSVIFCCNFHNFKCCHYFFTMLLVCIYPDRASSILVMEFCLKKLKIMLSGTEHEMNNTAY